MIKSQLDKQTNEEGKQKQIGYSSSSYLQRQSDHINALEQELASDEEGESAEEESEYESEEEKETVEKEIDKIYAMQDLR